MSYPIVVKKAVLISQFLVLAIQLSCVQTKSGQVQNAHTSKQPATQNSSEKPESTKSDQASRGIRLVDFRNFTYPWYPKLLEPPFGKKELTLRNGSFELPFDNKQRVTPLVVSLEHVLYDDLTGDRKEDAVVYLAGTIPTNSFVGSLMIYSLQGDKLVLLYRHETGDRGNGGLRAFRTENGRLIIEEYDPAVNLEQSLCCPKNYRRTYLRWKDGRFSGDKSEVLVNEYPNAFFVGYPTTQQ